MYSLPLLQNWWPHFMWFFYQFRLISHMSDNYTLYIAYKASRRTYVCLSMYTGYWCNMNPFGQLDPSESLTSGISGVLQCEAIFVHHILPNHGRQILPVCYDLHDGAYDFPAFLVECLTAPVRVEGVQTFLYSVVSSDKHGVECSQTDVLVGSGITWNVISSRFWWQLIANVLFCQYIKDGGPSSKPGACWSTNVHPSIFEELTTSCMHWSVRKIFMPRTMQLWCEM